MTELFIRDVAGQLGLTVLKRVTTGDERSGFATFELSGPADKLHAAWQDLSRHSRGPAFDRVTRVSNPEHPDHGKLYIALESVYFDDK